MNLDALSLLLHDAVFLPRGEAVAGGALRVLPELVDGVPPLRLEGGGVRLVGSVRVPVPSPEVVAEASAGGGPGVERYAATLGGWMVEAAGVSPAALPLGALLVAGMAAQVTEAGGEATARAAESMRAAVARALAVAHGAEARVPRLAAAVAASPAVFRLVGPVADPWAVPAGVLSVLAPGLDPGSFVRLVGLVGEAVAEVHARAEGGRSQPGDAAVLGVVPPEVTGSRSGWPVELFGVVLPALGTLLPRAGGEEVGDPVRAVALAGELARVWRQLGRWEVLARLARVVSGAPRRAAAGEATVMAIRLGGLRSQPALRARITAALDRLPAHAPRVDLGEVVLVALDDPEEALTEAAAVQGALPAPAAMALCHAGLEVRGDGERWLLWGPAAEGALRSVVAARSAEAGTVHADAAVVSRVTRSPALAARVRVDPGAGDRAGTRLTLLSAAGAPLAPAPPVADPQALRPAPAPDHDPFTLPPASGDPFASFPPTPAAPAPGAAAAEEYDDPFAVPMLDDDPTPPPPPQRREPAAPRGGRRAAPPPSFEPEGEEPSFFLPGVGSASGATPNPFQLEVVDEEDDSGPRSAPPAPPVVPPRLGAMPRVDLAEMLKGYVWFRDDEDLVFGRVYGKRVIDEHRYRTGDPGSAYVAFLRDKIREGFVPRTDLVGGLPPAARPATLDPTALVQAWETLS